MTEFLTTNYNEISKEVTFNDLKDKKLLRFDFKVDSRILIEL